VRVLAISGSLRAASNNTALLRVAAEEAPAGIEVDLWNDLRDVPPYDADDDLDPGPAAVEALRDAVRDADAVLIATPEYNGSIPGALKNAVDWVSRPFPTNAFRNKPVAVIGTSHGAFGGVWSQAELRKVLGIVGARVAPVELAVPLAEDKFGADGSLLDDALRPLVRGALATLVDAASPDLVAA